MEIRRLEDLDIINWHSRSAIYNTNNYYKKEEVEELVKHLLEPREDKIDKLIEWVKRESYPDNENGGEAVSTGYLLGKLKDLRSNNA